MRRTDDDTPRFADLRDGGNLPDERRCGSWGPWIVGCTGFWAAVAGLVAVL